MTMITGKLQIRAVQLLSVKGALHLESLGMKHSGGSVRKRWAEHYKLGSRAKIPAVVAAIDAEIKSINKQIEESRG